MKLGRASAYALLALMSIARRNGNGDGHDGGGGDEGGGGGLTACAIARATGVPVEYLRKIMQRLTHARIVRSERGRAGGFHLRRRPDRVNLLQVVEAIEGPIDEIAILDDPHLHASNDPVHQHLKRWRHTATTRLREMLRETTLHDILAVPLGREAPGPQIRMSNIEIRNKSESRIPNVRNKRRP